MTTITATPPQIEGVIAAVLPHVEPDGYHPALTCVRLELTADTFVAVATDRYTLGICWSPLKAWNEDAEPGDPIAVNVYARDLKRLFTFLKPHKKIHATWDITEYSMTVTVAGESLSVRTVTVDFVNWRGMLPKVLDKPNEAIPMMGFRPHHVGKFIQSAKVLGEQSMYWQLGSAHTDAPVVQIGDRFLGVLMPLRIPDDQPALDLSPLGVIPATPELAA